MVYYALFKMVTKDYNNIRKYYDSNCWVMTIKEFSCYC